MNTKDEYYNGWTNYETWSIALFIDNDETFQKDVQELFKKSTNEYVNEWNLRDYVEETILDIESLSMYQKQMIQSALSVVNWRELIKHLQEE